MRLTDIAMRIDIHLKRFERDASVNVVDPHYGTRPYYNASAHRAGSRIRVVYVSYYQRGVTLTRDDALAYLAKLDEGYVGKHHGILDRTEEQS